MPESFARETIVLPLDDEARLVELLRREGDTIAAVIIEPVPANNGLLLQRPEFLATLRRETVDAALLDINLQGELVYPVANALAERGVPFVFVTAHAASEIPEPYCHRPVVTKPYYDAAVC